jgi:hypothetical protein
MSKETSDILWSIGAIILGTVFFLSNRKKDPNYKDKYGFRMRAIITSIVLVILGIFALCKTLFF